MSLHPPNTDRPPASVGWADSAAESGADVGSRGPSPLRGTTAHRTRRRDYRLRGLDLGAQAVAEGPPLPLPRPRRDPRRRRRTVVQLVVLAAVAAAVAVLLRSMVIEPYSVTSPSMVPTLQVGYRILVVKSDVLPEALKTGDIIVVRRPSSATCGTDGTTRDLVKRVIGLPGQTIWSAGDSIYVDGRQLHEPLGWYNPPYGQLGPTAIARTTIPRGDYFVLGDNRTDTCDSRSFGPVPRSLVVGKVFAVLLDHGHVHVRLF